MAKEDTQFKRGHKLGMTGKHHTKETIEKISLSNKLSFHRGNVESLIRWRKNGGIPWNKGNGKKIIKKCFHCRKSFQVPFYLEKTKYCSKKCWGLSNREENHYKWKGKNRQCKQCRNDGLYIWWVKQVKKRDKNICKLKAENCFGYNVVHHIKGWTKYPELRYKLKNGITLCQFHHPHKRKDEIKMIPIFQKLVNQS